MPSSKLIVVVGSTGNQGGSVADAFLSGPHWRVRALARNASSTKAQALADHGAEIVQADLNDPSTLAPAFDGAEVIFAVSDVFGLYGNPANNDKATAGQPLNVWAAKQETQQLKNIIDAAAEGKYTHVYQFDSKAAAEEYRDKTYPNLWAKTSIFQAGFYLSNFVTNPMMQSIKGQDGVVQFISNLKSDNKLPFIAAEKDSGPIIKALLQEPAVKNIHGYREQLTLREFAALFASAVLFRRREHARLFARYGANMEARDSKDRAPLHLAISSPELQVPDTELDRELIELGADMNVTTICHGIGNERSTLLHLAAQVDGPAEVIQDLLHAGARSDHADEDGYTPLHTAAAGNHVANIELLAHQERSKC